MPSNEHLALKFDICTILQSAQPDETVKTAGRILSTILAALQEPTEGMVKLGEDAFDAQLLLRVTENKKGYPSEATHELPSRVAWRAMLAVSALGEQSE
ncbi:hypothetical protein NJB95_07170 [Brucella intermedia]|uniref:hypothetical protein n=1 Tax=Brucella intermedia TaxID=94625 RepID=UPI00209B1F22|nr:hypothetical protein [Brucella intermedia]MCO7736391.1 hypothetical protein [Brucella intermedia]WLF99065.1 hypothetical protein Q5698_15225 [Brucella intermedia]